MADAQTVNIPQLLAFVLISAVVIRYFFFSTSSSGPAGRPAASFAQRRVNEQSVEDIQSMFPQLSRRDIVWDLMRNGGSVQATTERILGGGGLETPPHSFQPPAPPASSSAARTTPTASPAAASKPSPPDLITRYDLASKLSASSPDTFPSTSSDAGLLDTRSGKQTWSQNKVERQRLLQRRKEEMILAARRNLEKRERTKDLSHND